MILILSQHKKLVQTLVKELEKQAFDYLCLDAQDPQSLKRAYDKGVRTLICDASLPGLPVAQVEDVLNGLARRIVVIALRGIEGEPSKEQGERAQFSELVTVIESATVKAVLSAMGFERDNRASRHVKKTEIEIYNPKSAIDLLKAHGGLGVLTIDNTSFRKVEVDYGYEVFCRVKEVFREILSELQGRTGCFRVRDILLKHGTQDNIYILLLQRSRFKGGLPLPGTLEKIADRVSHSIENTLWHELSIEGEKRRLPECIRDLPPVSVGYAATIYNPCLDSVEAVQSLIEHSFAAASVQRVRVRNRQKEILQTLIQAEDLLVPNYQGVFKLQEITKALVDESAAQKSIAPLQAHLFGFESLIRVQTDRVGTHLGTESRMVNPSLLRPGLLFYLAQETNVSLELDQACLYQAVKHSMRLPGMLMVNVLPRSLYSLEYLKNLLQDRKNVMLEISESESIHNLSLISRVKEHLLAQDVRIAADDFGKANAGLEHVIKIKPQLIKLDRGLVENIDSDPIKKEHIKGLVAVARLLNASILAEGIERWPEAECLKSLGIDYIQGFLLHRPQPVNVVLGQLSLPNIKKQSGLKKAA